MSNIIECINLSHVYPEGFTAIKGINLKVKEGEVVAILGQNGSGKTTLVKHFNGLLKPTNGTVSIRGNDTAKQTVFNLSSHAGYVFQNPNHQLFATSVLAELEFGPKNQGLANDEIEARVEEATDFFELNTIINEHPLRLSFPLRKIVAMASIYAMQPSIFRLDEPTTAQDHGGSEKVRKFLRKLQDDGKTVILVTHDMPLVAEVADRVIAMWSSEIISAANPREFFLDLNTLDKTKLQQPQATALSHRLQKRVLNEGITLTVQETIKAFEKVVNKKIN
jgi:energy-coupling factor transport system ATP-binding protein